MVEEVWRGIEGFPGYEVSDEGRVRHGERVLHPSSTVGGYLRAMLARGGVRSQKYIHRLVLEAFQGPAVPDGMACRHIDRNAANNRAANLTWGDPRTARDDGRRNGRPTGRRDRWTVAAMKRDLLDGRAAADVSSWYDVSPWAVSLTARGLRNERAVPLPPRALSPEEVAEAREMLRRHDIATVAKFLSVSCGAVYDIV